jgi:hypothetical protein
LEVVLLVVVEDDGAAVVELVLLVVLVACWLPGMHWEYQSLILLQDEPDWQHVAPVHPLPPHWVLNTIVSVKPCP